METKDNYLRSLRRQRRIQLEEMEKEVLKRKIKEYEHQRASLLGYQNNQPKKKVDVRYLSKTKLL